MGTQSRGDGGEGRQGGQGWHTCCQPPVTTARSRSRKQTQCHRRGCCPLSRLPTKANEPPALPSTSSHGARGPMRAYFRRTARSEVPLPSPPTPFPSGSPSWAGWAAERPALSPGRLSVRKWNLARTCISGSWRSSPLTGSDGTRHDFFKAARIRIPTPGALSRRRLCTPLGPQLCVSAAERPAPPHRSRCSSAHTALSHLSTTRLCPCSSDPPQLGRHPQAQLRCSPPSAHAQEPRHDHVIFRKYPLATTHSHGAVIEPMDQGGGGRAISAMSSPPGHHCGTSLRECGSSSHHFSTYFNSVRTKMCTVYSAHSFLQFCVANMQILHIFRCTYPKTLDTAAAKVRDIPSKQHGFFYGHLIRRNPRDPVYQADGS